MQIVIELDENEFIEVSRDYYSGTPFENRIFYAVANGTPLPKGHGRLGDLDYLYKKFVANKCNDSRVLEFIKDEPTVLEADKEI